MVVYFQYEDVRGKDVSQAVAVQQFYGIIAGSLNSVRKFCDRVPGVSELTPSDRETLLQSAALELFVLRLAYRYRRRFTRRNDLNFHVLL